MDNLQHLETDSAELQESVILIGLSVAQIESSLAEGGLSIEQLIKNFQSMSNKLTEFSKGIQSKTDIKALKKEIDESTIAFQFYDRLQQRLGHVSQSLILLSELVSDQESFKQPEKWDQLKERVRKSYTMESERDLFKLIYEDEIAIADALSAIIEDSINRTKEKGSSQEDDVTLF